MDGKTLVYKTWANFLELLKHKAQYNYAYQNRLTNLLLVSCSILLSIYSCSAIFVLLHQLYENVLWLTGFICS